MSYPELNEQQETIFQICEDYFKHNMLPASNAESISTFLNGCSNFSKAVFRYFDGQSDETHDLHNKVEMLFSEYRSAVTELYFELNSNSKNITFGIDGLEGKEAAMQAMVLLRELMKQHIRYEMDLTLYRLTVVAIALALSNSVKKSMATRAMIAYTKASALSFAGHELYNHTVRTCERSDKIPGVGDEALTIEHFLNLSDFVR